MKATFLMLIASIIVFCSISAFALPDAQTVSTITYTPTTIISGDAVTFSLNFKIVDEAVTNFKVEGGVDGAVLYTRTFSSISAGATRTMSFTWTATGGNHVVYFKLDPANAIAESNENNNLQELPLEISGVQQQTELNFNVGPQITPGDQLFTGKSLNIKAQVYNHNNPVANVKIRATMDGAQVWQTTVAQMAANSYYWVDFNWVATVGSHTLNIIIDPDNTIAESNETNNEWPYPVIITDPVQPPDPSDLTDLKFNGNITVTPFSVQEGDSQVIKVRVNNASSIAVNNIKIEGGMDSVKMHEENIPSMNPYSYYDVQFTWTATVAGNHIAYFKVDADNSIGENNETNNTLTYTTIVTAKQTGPTPGLPCDPQLDSVNGINVSKGGTLKPQETVKLQAKVKLSGNTAVSLKVTAGVDDKILKEEVFPQYPEGQVSVISFDWKSNISGSHKVWFQVDPDNQQNDTNRDNNRLERTIEIAQFQSATSPAGLEAKINADPCETAASPKPDLHIISFEQKTPYSSDKVHFKVVVKNETDRCVKGAGFGIYHEGISAGPVFKFWVNSSGKIVTSPYSVGGPSNNWFLKANETKTLLYYIPAHMLSNPSDCVIAAAGNVPGYCKNLKIKADFEDNITESDETNNASPFKEFSWKK